ncbi:MAG: homoserine O-acetyltransferase [Bosea sp. (in: a-proteobacteria)]|uniref:E22 family MetX-like putative esterase n=1 Tax=Bosea sp. (in: a-proteobacteria) TaxID=1871050 RepID=UPI0027322EF0|nr:homoserine O-acetyltransferase [Bosea sp. (in: a-proteobacteria)]MDP3257546.1 homoserine O-acetyltransferase [Bosea sp. (in: a-proteobacteria)]MDP3317660.1 homoserine O-acetyltransferase [Bosea sp. (in: a-proteobacteria)]
MNHWIAATAGLLGWMAMDLMTGGAPAAAQEMMTEKQVFSLERFTTQSGRTLKDVKIGWESYGTLNADKSNAVLICHFFSGNSHAAGKYDAKDAAPGYWDAIIGPGKAIDTDKYFVLSSDTLVNLNTGDPKTTTTGPASIDPDTGKPYGLDFPVVTVGDFVNVQKALVESLGIRRLALVAGPSMGSLQTFEWAARYPEMVAKAMPVIGAGEADAQLIAWLDVWAAPILVDPNWNRGDYYGRTPPNAGLAKALTAVTLQANHADWANATFGRRAAKEGEDPAKALGSKFQVQSILDNAGEARAKVSDANHFLYLVKANQLFAAGGTSLADAATKIKAPVLLITQPKDLVFTADAVDRTADTLRKGGVDLAHVHIQGSRGHLDGVISMKQAEGAIRAFLAR